MRILDCIDLGFESVCRECGKGEWTVWTSAGA